MARDFVSPNLKIVKRSGGIALPRVKKYSFNSLCCYYQKMLGIRKVFFFKGGSL